MRTIVVMVVPSGGKGDNQTDSGKKDDCFSLKLLKKYHGLSFYLTKSFFSSMVKRNIGKKCPYVNTQPVAGSFVF